MDSTSLSHPLPMGDISAERRSILEGVLDYVRTLRASRNTRLAAAAVELEHELGQRLAPMAEPAAKEVAA